MMITGKTGKARCRAALFVFAIALFLSVFYTGCRGAIGQKEEPPTGRQTLIECDFPQALLAFEALQKGGTAIDLSAARTIAVYAGTGLDGSRREYVIDDPPIIEAVQNALGQIVVTGKSDCGSIDDAAEYVLTFQDAADQAIASFRFIQNDGFLLNGHGTALGFYSTEGAEVLFATEGIVSKYTVEKEQ